MHFLTLIITSLLAAASYAQSSSFTPLRPPAIPLAVKGSAYMSTWQQAGSDGGNGGYLAGQWPTFWNGQVTGWEGLIRVDNKIYTWMGASNQSNVTAQQTAFKYTSTRSIFTLNVGGFVQMKVTFLSPVSPDDLLRSSLPYTYMDVEVSSLDGESHDVQLYTDISAEWVSGDRSAIAQWKYGVIRPGSTSPPTTSDSTTSAQNKRATIAKRRSGGIAYHEIWRQQQLEFSETADQADWGYWYWATSNTQNLTYQSGADVDVRGQFINNGRLADTQDTDYRAIDDNFPVFGFAIDLGSISTTAVSTLFQLSLHQEDCVQFEGADGVQPVPCLWTSYFSDKRSAVSYFYKDYEDCSTTTSKLDKQIESDSKAAGGQNYLSLTSLALRQAFGALAYSNKPNQPWVFLKEISSGDDIQTVDVIFPFHPVAIYTNPNILKWMLDPLFINQEAGNWPYKYSIHDLGTFPNATGHNDGNDEKQPLEECGDMLIMTLAYAQRTNDNAYLSQHYELLKQWNNYLVNDSLIPANQISTDDFAGSLANQTNLAIKGIIGIEAMAQIANRTDHVKDGKHFTHIAHKYVQKWMDFGIAQTSDNFTLPHTTLAYGMNNTYSLLYNLFGDKELGLDLVPQSVYDMESNFYPTVFQKYGVPLDTRHGYTKTDWEIFCAAVANTDTKNEFTSVVAEWLDQTPTNHAFTDLYSTFNGDYPPGITFIARPVVGGMFAFLALDSAPSSGTVLPS